MNTIVQYGVVTVQGQITDDEMRERVTALLGATDIQIEAGCEADVAGPLDGMSWVILATVPWKLWTELKRKEYVRYTDGTIVVEAEMP